MLILVINIVAILIIFVSIANSADDVPLTIKYPVDDSENTIIGGGGNGNPSPTPQIIFVEVDNTNLKQAKLKFKIQGATLYDAEIEEQFLTFGKVKLIGDIPSGNYEYVFDMEDLLSNRKFIIRGKSSANNIVSNSITGTATKKVHIVTERWWPYFGAEGVGLAGGTLTAYLGIHLTKYSFGIPIRYDVRISKVNLNIDPSGEIANQRLYDVKYGLKVDGKEDIGYVFNSFNPGTNMELIPLLKRAGDPSSSYRKALSILTNSNKEVTGIVYGSAILKFPEGIVPGIAINERKFSFKLSEAGNQKPDDKILDLTNSYETNTIVISNITDFGSDLDNDGLFDKLVVEFQIGLDQLGFYTIQSEITDGSDLIIEENIYQSIHDEGTETIKLEYKGVNIYNSGINGPYTISNITIFLETQQIQQLDDIATNNYLFNEFQQPGIFILNNFSETTTDIDNNTLIDELVINNNVNITKDGNYSMHGSLRDQQGSLIGFTNNSGFFYQGLQNIPLSFDGQMLNNKGINGPYLVNITYQDNEGEFQDSIYYYQTNNYLASQFQTLKTYIIGDISDRGIDTDDDGLFNNLELTFRVNATESEILGFNGFIFNDRFVSVSSNETSVAGEKTISLIFDGQEIRRSRINGSFNLRNLEVYRNYPWVVINSNSINYTTTNYNFTDFQKLDTEIIGNFNDFAVDVNDNGFFDFLVMNFSIDVDIEGNYTVLGVLKLNNTLPISSINNLHLSSGSHTINVSFPGDIIHRNGISSNYNLTFLQVSKENKLSDEIIPALLTSFYNSTDFETGGAPILNYIGNRTINENETLSIDLNGRDPDNDTLTYYTSAGEVLLDNFTFESVTGLFEWTPTYNDSGQYNIRFNVTDGNFWDSESITVTVDDVSLIPSLIKSNSKRYNKKLF